MFYKNEQVSMIRSDQRRGNQGPISVDHNMDLQSSAQKKPKKSRSNESNEDLTPPTALRSRSSVTRQEFLQMTTFLPSLGSQATKKRSSTVSLRQNSQSGNERYSSFGSKNAPLASSEDINIDNSIQDLVNQSARTSTSRTPIQRDAAKLRKDCQYSSHEKTKTEDTFVKSLSQTGLQLHRSKDKPIPKARSKSDSRSFLSTNWKTQNEELKGNIREIPRLSQKQIKTTRSSSRDDDIHTTPQKRIRTKSVSNCLDLTIVPAPFPEKTYASPLETKQDYVKDIPQPVESSLQEESHQKTNTFRDTLLSETDVQRGRCGLRNIGNTCFMNSALQCLSNIPDLTEYILENGVDSILNTTNDLGTYGNLALAYAKLIKEMWSGKKTVTDGSTVKRYVSELSPRFAGFSQQDSHEFLNVLLDALHEDLKQESDNIEYETSLISEIFHGKIRSTVTCKCGEPLTTFDSISFLALPIPDLPPVPPRRKYPGESVKRTVTLTDCFNELFKIEILSENGQWFCNKCDCLMDAEKTLDLWAPPKVLILQLKRFTYDISSNVKIQTLVEFPFDCALDLRQFIADPDYKDNTLYDLVAISSHVGSLAGGHYTTYAKNFLTEEWLHFNDNTVNVAEKEALQSSNAYILVYRRQETKLYR